MAAMVASPSGQRLELEALCFLALESVELVTAHMQQALVESSRSMEALQGLTEAVVATMVVE
jgi:hypothetical protein